jgi:polygalacturonase
MLALPSRGLPTQPVRAPPWTGRPAASSPVLHRRDPPAQLRRPAPGGRLDDANHWWNWKNLETPDFDLLETKADDNVPVAQRVFGPGHYLPPQMIQPFRTDTVLIQGVTIINSPFWHLNPNLGHNVTVEGVSISSSGPNTDGCDPESCSGVVIDGVTFNTGDDCIAIKSGRDADGRRLIVPSQNLVIQNCTFANGHGGITLGSEMTGGVKNVYARDLTMNSANLQAGHRIETNTLRGGYALNSNVYRITATTVGGPLLLIQGNYNAQTGDFPPDISGITLADWTVGPVPGSGRWSGRPRQTRSVPSPWTTSPSPPRPPPTLRSTCPTSSSRT